MRLAVIARLRLAKPAADMTPVIINIGTEKKLAAAIQGAMTCARDNTSGSLWKSLNSHELENTNISRSEPVTSIPIRLDTFTVLFIRSKLRAPAACPAIAPSPLIMDQIGIRANCSRREYRVNDVRIMGLISIMIRL